MPMLCRTCGQGAEYSRDLFDQESTDILDNILKLTGILLTNENGVPTRICVSCLLDLKEAIAFRERCITTNNLWFEEQNDLEELDAANKEAELEILSRVSAEDSNEEDGITPDTTDEVIYPLGTHDAIPAEEDLDPLMSKETIKVENESLHSDAEPCGYDTQELKETSPPPAPATRKKRGRPPKMHKKKDTPEMKAARSKRKRIRAMAKGLYFCDQCGKSFNDSSNFSTHLTRHTGVKKFECKECDRKEFTQHLLNLHVRIKHRGELPYVCKYCGQRFGNCNYRLKHERNHNPGPRKYKCPICDKGFKDSKTLKDHGLVHSGEHPFHCKLCQTHFGKKTSLKTHLRSIGHRKRAEEQQKNPEDEDLYTMPKPTSTRGPGNHSVYHTKIELNNK